MTNPPSPLLAMFEEREKRKNDLRDTQDWLRLEGLSIPPEDLPLFEDYVDGRRTSEEVLAELTRRYARR